MCRGTQHWDIPTGIWSDSSGLLQSSLASRKVENVLCEGLGVSGARLIVQWRFWWQCMCVEEQHTVTLAPPFDQMAADFSQVLLPLERVRKPSAKDYVWIALQREWRRVSGGVFCGRRGSSSTLSVSFEVMPADFSLAFGPRRRVRSLCPKGQV